MTMNQTFKHVLAVGVAAIAMSGCTGGGDAPKLQAEPNVDLIQDMMESPALKAQDFDTYDRTKPASRLPPENTVPVGHEKYPYHLKPEEAARNLKNPFSGDMSPELIELGRTKYEIYCAVCHGYEGKGDGPVSPKMALKPPTLLSDKIVNLNDGGLFHIITDGQGVMSSYAYQLVNPRDRWAIVNYVRSLQKLARTGNSGAARPGTTQPAQTVPAGQ